MEIKDWLSRWESGQTGWHQADGSAALRKFWPRLAPGSRVLVPLCGKSPDILWLAEQGYEVTGVELSEVAARAFFAEADIRFEVIKSAGFKWFRGLDKQLAIACGDYFKFADRPFDALYDRASLVALPPDMRVLYIQHTKRLLKEGAVQLLITLEYNQSKAGGPPFSVLPDEVKSYWPVMERAGERSDASNMPPRFREAGIKELIEVVWVAGAG
jgi:thiopurine S-methyltransferase